jgi:lipoyl(octanoyl) transferase
MVQWITLKGLVEYEATLKLMETKVYEVINKISPETIFLLEHQDVYSAGTSFKPEELLDAQDIPVIYTGRGGKFTYHGKGQRIIYPILDLSNSWREKDLRAYISKLEQWIINVLVHFNIEAFVIRNLVGVFVKYKQKEAKIASIGLRVRRWVTYHGISINISTNISKFLSIIPCGLKDFQVISMAELGVVIDIIEFDHILKIEFERILGSNIS